MKIGRRLFILSRRVGWNISPDNTVTCVVYIMLGGFGGSCAVNQVFLTPTNGIKWLLPLNSGDISLVFLSLVT